MTHLSLTLLGTFQVGLEDQSLRFRANNVQGLLAYLALQPQRAILRETLAALFWPDSPESSAKKNLRQLIYQLRQLLQDNDQRERPFLLVSRKMVQFNPDADFAVDVLHFGQALAAGVLETAVSLYQGELLSGFTCDSLEFEAWLRQEREHLHRLALNAMSDLTERQISNGAYTDAQATAQKQLKFEPWRETAHQQLMRAYAFAGERSAALAQYQRCSQSLDEELGVLPSPETAALLAQIESGELTAVDPNLLAGRYRLGDQIGQGAMGIVYRGLDTETGQMVAIKLLDPSRVADQPDLIERFLREGEALRRLAHPNIVELLATEERNGRYYLIMAYYGGGDLQQRLHKEAPLPLDEALAIGLDIADALTRAHRLNILHRDIKPANVLLDEEGRPRLSDFGIARLGLNSEITQTGMVLGTTAFLSPEACTGIAVDERADIWAFGLLLHEMVTGVHPFQKPTIAATLMAILQTPLPDIQLNYPHLPQPLTDLLTQMLAKEMDERLPSMRHVAAVLEAILHNNELPSLPILQTKTNISIPAGPIKLTPLPPADPNFVGRVVEINRSIQLLNKPTTRIVTLCGAGGVGKTALAIQVAHEWKKNREHTVSFVPLGDVFEAVTAQHLIQAVIAQENSSSATHLLLLDGVESLLATAGDVFVDWLENFVLQTSSTHVLLTSQQPLNIQQEWLLPIAGLPYPFSAQIHADNWQQYDALLLFQQRAQQASGTTFDITPQNSAAIARLCQLLEGSPLAISLAASLTRQQNVSDILHLVQNDLAALAADLRDLPRHHRSLYGLFARSWQLLSEREQAALVQTAVFQQGFSRAAAKAVLQDNAYLLPVLVEKSMLHLEATPSGATHHRYALSPLLQSFLLEQSVVQNGVKDRHAEYYLAWAVDNQALFATERENLLAAWNWAQVTPSISLPRQFQQKWLEELKTMPERQPVVTDVWADTAVLVGRDEEVNTLRAGLVPILHEHRNGGLFTIIGDAGIGKTELVTHLRGEENSTIWFDCPCDELSAQSYHPFRIWLRHYFRQKPVQTTKENKALFFARLHDLIHAISDNELAEELTRNQSFLAALAGLVLPDSPYTKLRPEQRNENFKQAIKALIKAESLLQPVVVHIEDAHWLDADSRQLLENLLLHVTEYPFAIILTARPDGFEPIVLLDAPQTTIRLHPLDGVAVHQLAATHLQTQPSEALENLLLNRGQGNPFYMTQLLFYLRDNGLIVNGDLVRGSSQASLDALIPVDVHNLLVARLGQLDTAVRDVVSQAAVLGHEFSLPVLQEMVGETALENALVIGQDTGIWQPRATGRYLFNHALLRDAAYGSQFKERKQELHQKAAEAITAVSTPEQSNHATLAHHYDEAGHSRKAVANYLKAGDEARENYFIHEAHQYYTRGLELAGTDKQRLPLLLGRENVNHWLGNREEQAEDLRRLTPLASAKRDQAMIADVMLRQATYALVTRNYTKAIQQAQRASSLAVANNDRRLEARAMHRWGRALWQQGKPKAARPILRRALKLAETAVEIYEQALALYDLSALAYYDDDFAQAKTLLAQAISLFRQMDSKTDMARCDTMLGLIEYAEGRYEASLQYYVRALELSRIISWVYGEARSLAEIGKVYFQLGDFVNSRDFYTKSLALCHTLGDHETEVICIDALGLILQFEGKLAAAQESFEKALTIARTIGNPEFEAYALTHLGIVLTNQEAIEQASIYLYEAMALREGTQGVGISQDSAAALAWLDMARGDIGFAVERAQEILHWLMQNGVAGVELPLQVYWQCYTILQMAGETISAKHALQAAHALLMEQAAQIENEMWRERFLLAVPHHRHIFEAWEAQPN